MEPIIKINPGKDWGFSRQLICAIASWLISGAMALGIGITGVYGFVRVVGVAIEHGTPCQ